MNKYIIKKALWLLLIIGFVLCIVFLFSEKERFKRNLIVNEITDVIEVDFDSEEKAVEYDEIILEYGGFKRVNIDEEYELVRSFCRYVKKDNNSELYDVLWDCGLVYSNNVSNINISFSKKGIPLKKYIIGDTKLDVSIFEDTVVTISKYRENYMVNFKYDDIYYDIIASNIKEDKVMEIVAAIVLDE